jgi:hypothetical protein
VRILRGIRVGTHLLGIVDEILDEWSANRKLSGFHGGISPLKSASVELARILGSVRCIQTLLAVPKSAWGKRRASECGSRPDLLEPRFSLPTAPLVSDSL